MLRDRTELFTRIIESNSEVVKSQGRIIEKLGELDPKKPKR